MGFQWEIRKNRTMAFLEYTTKTKVIGDDERRRLTPKFSGESNGDVIFPKFSILEVEKLNFKCFFYVELCSPYRKTVENSKEKYSSPQTT